MKNKFIIISLIFMLILSFFTFSCNVYASNDFNINSVPSISGFVGDNDKYFIVCYGNNKYILYIQRANSSNGCNNNIVVYKDGDNYCLKTYGYQITDKYRLFLNRDNDWCWGGNVDKYVDSSWVIPLDTVSDDFNFIVYSCEDIYDTSGNVVFHAPPVGITQVLLEETTKAKIMGQIKTMIAGFLKYLIALVISVIAFYKGWKFLSTQLKKS